MENAGNWPGTVHLGPFKIDLEPPGVPTNLNPTNGTITNDTTPTLSWDAPSDSGGSGIKNYRYQVDDEPSFSSPWVKNGYTTNTYYTPNLAEGTYYWRVRARDNAGNNGDWTAAQQLIVDTTPPAVTNVTVNDTLITDADVGAGNFTVTVDFSEAMDTTVAPAIVFDPAVGGTLTFNSGGWTDADTYQASYDVAEANGDVDNVQIDATGAEEGAGKDQQDYTPENEFGIDTLNPTVSNVTVNETPITEAN